MTEKPILTAAEAELYDRQIRLWGIESQEKLRAANVLLIGVRCLGSEIAKDILLSGINSLTILDDAVVTDSEQMTNFLLTKDSIDKKIAEAVLLKAQALNPLVSITTDTDNVSKKDEAFFAAFTIIIGTCLDSKNILNISSICRKRNIQFICGDVFGMFGYSIADFQEHKYYMEYTKRMPKTEAGSLKRKHDGDKLLYEDTEIKEEGTMKYPDLAAVLTAKSTGLSAVKLRRRSPYYYLMLALFRFRSEQNRNPSAAKKPSDIELLKEYKREVLLEAEQPETKLSDEALSVLFGDIVPICSIVAGVMAQEVIKAVSGKEVPIYNVFLLNPFTYDGTEELIGA